MPRKDFVRDLQEAQNGALPSNIISVQPGRDDGALVIIFQCPNSQQIQIYAQISDVGDYPRSHSFFVFTDSENVLPDVSLALNEVSILNDATVSRAITQIAASLNSATGEVVEDENTSMPDVEEDFDEDYQSDEFLIEEEEYELHLHDKKPSIASKYTSTKLPGFLSSLSEKDRKAFSDQVHQDISLIREAGFRVSHQGNIFSPGISCMLMVSIRVAKLELPEDALEAWHLHPSEYIMLLLKFKQGYCTLKMLQSSPQTQEYLTMHILVTKKYKLKVEEVSEATEMQKGKGDDRETAEKTNDLDRVIRPLFIGTALEYLLNSRLHTLIQFRLDLRLNWAGATAYYNARQGEVRSNRLDMSRFDCAKDDSKIKNLPRYIQTDSIQEMSVPQLEKLSFPWIAMQFTLRHIVRCTEFCLVCFDKTRDDFEALKPYVCSNPLCLYQYMAMGLGPGIEFEILSQKYVVDLLVSFCWESAQTGNLKQFPIGLGLMVPDPTLIPGYVSPAYTPGYMYGNVQSTIPNAKSTLAATNSKPLVEGNWSRKHNEIVLIDKSDIKSAFKVGDWLAFWTTDSQVYHCQLTEKSQSNYRYRHIIKSHNTLNSRESEVRTKVESTIETVKIKIIPYDMLFDSLKDSSKYVVIRMLLDTLPNVLEMSEYLRTSQGLRGQLIGWTERIIPTALSVLRWIIASNRSCIVYNERTSSDEVVYGMPGYLQFRFASGAPDKESRFIKNVDEVETRLKQKCPTIFAWHGSPLKNWHAIIREGLNFDQVVNGRAYGNGVYHAMDARTSVSYSARYTASSSWSSSLLNIQQALSLNEIVNAPEEFQSRNPFLVVQKIDWIQTRYLFVKCSKSELTKDWELRPKPSFIMKQDSGYTPQDELSTPLVIPACAISRSRRQIQNLEHRGARNSRHPLSPSIDRQIIISDESDDEDIVFWDTSETAESSFSQPLSNEKQRNSISSAVTPFQPGQIDRSKLPILASPTYATPISTRTLHRELQSMLLEQSKTPPAELGWYLDPNHVDNVYQWTVELHSFDKSLPLAKDMLKEGIESVVLEIRFGPNFNFSPPFIRVIQPRFLPFMMGGGGHVTGGGAICMELLTSNGWNPSSTMSAVLLQVRMAITSLDPKPARLVQGSSSSVYSSGEAAQAYTRACMAHGWTVPDDFKSMLSMTEVVRPIIPPPTARKTGTGRVSHPLLVDDDDDDDMLATSRPYHKKQRRI